MNSLKRTAIALAAAMTLAPLAAQAADVIVVNHGANVIHPYFKSNCWNPAFIEKTNDWVFFGGILPGTQFTWDGFQQLLDPACKKTATLKFTFTEEGDPPLGKAIKRRVVNFGAFDPAQNYTVRLGNSVEIKEVTPASTEDAD